MNISCKLYGFLLLAYPPEFRDEFGGQMVQVFRDCYRAETRRRSLLAFWSWTLFDLIVSAAKERSRKENTIMNRNLVAALGSIAIIVIAFLLLTYGRKNEVASILLFGHILDALVTTGVIGNLVAFILIKMTKFDPLRIALWTFAIVHAGLLLIAMVLVSRVEPRFNATATVIGYVVSFAIWAGLHFAWRHRPPVYS